MKILKIAKEQFLTLANKVKTDKMEKNKEKVELENGFTYNQVCTSDKITISKNNLSATELKIFYQCATLIDPLKDKDFRHYTISVNDFCTTLGINTTNRAFIIAALRSMLKKTFEVELPNGDWRGYTIFSKMGYLHEKQQVEISFNYDMVGFLLELKEKFTKIEQVKYINAFHSKYAIRIYTMLKDYRKMGHRDFEIEKLVTLFMLPKSYSDYSYIFKKVLTPAIKEINEKSDLYVNEPIILKKQGKKITKIRLEFGNKADKMSDDFCRALLNLYKKLKTFNVFINCKWRDEKGNTVTITRIEANHSNYYQCFYNHGDLACIGTPNKDNFLNEIIVGIYRAIQYKYENEKQNILPVEEWQNNKDRLAYFKATYNQWRSAKNN